jgi:hypothetical protein
MPWQWLVNPQPCYRTASVQASGVSMPRLLLRRFKRRTVIAPPRYHASLAAHSVRLSDAASSPSGVSPSSATMGLCSRIRARLSPACRACLLRSFRFARRSCAMLRHARTHAPAMLLSYSVVKSFLTLLIQQSKAVTISLSVGCGSAILSESSRLRLHPTHLPSLRTSASPRIQRICAV